MGLAVYSPSMSDGDHPPGNHFLESIPGIGIAVPVHHIRLGQQHLGHHLAVFPEKPFIDMHQDALAHGGTGLFPRDGGRLGLQAHPAHPGSPGPGRHQDHFLPLVLEVRHDPGQFLDLFIVDLSVGIGNGTGPDFYHHAFDFRNFTAIHGINPSVHIG